MEKFLTYQEYKEKKEEKRLATLSDEEERKLQQYAVLKSLIAGAEEELKRLKPEVEEIMKEKYDEDKKDKAKVSLNGCDIGSVVACKTKSKYYVTDEISFIEFLQIYDLGDEEIKIQKQAMQTIYKKIMDHPDTLGLEPVDCFEWIPKPSKEFEKQVEPFQDVCLFTLGSETDHPKTVIVPGIKPAQKKVNAVQCRVKPIQEIMPILNHEQTIQLLGGKDGREDL